MPPETLEPRGYSASTRAAARGESEAENRLVAVTITATGHRSEFGYDGMGRRVAIRELDPDQTQTLQVSSDKKYLWDGAEIAEERDSTGAIVNKRFYDQGVVDSDGTILFYTRDHLGSIRELTDNSQTVRARYDYDPYGRMAKVQGDKDSPFTYTGHFWHAQSGLNLTLFRAYDPNLGRWISRDPIEEKGGQNLYLYSLSDPVNRVDKFGNKPTVIGGVKSGANWADRWDLYRRCKEASKVNSENPWKNIPFDPNDDEVDCYKKAKKAQKDNLKSIPSLLDCLQGLWSNSFPSNWVTEIGISLGGG